MYLEFISKKTIRKNTSTQGCKKKLLPQSNWKRRSRKVEEVEKVGKRRMEEAACRNAGWSFRAHPASYRSNNVFVYYAHTHTHTLPIYWIITQNWRFIYYFFSGQSVMEFLNFSPCFYLYSKNIRLLYF